MKLEFLKKFYTRMHKDLAAYRLKKRTREFRDMLMSPETDMKKLTERLSHCGADREMMGELLSKPTVYDITLERMLLMLKVKRARGDEVSDSVYSLLQGFDILYGDLHTSRTPLLNFMKSLILDDATGPNTLEEVSLCMITVSDNAQAAARDLMYFALVANAKTRANALEVLRSYICAEDPDFDHNAEAAQDVLFSAMNAIPTSVAQDVRHDTVAFVQNILNSAEFQIETANNSPKYESTITGLAGFMDRVKQVMDAASSSTN